ncbi:hypothetical protein [Agromyces larvae]|uniref:Uncharacterized protein n=1 Tax=Agromyces larvae TaxID=2929802 RepID=A0ABY4C682_9MICO|nr:hypothetical protein [Agromyces larvae]UOE45932.1 hypothetical protein MTO99_09385 [Agromyces larvae]
MTEHRDPGTVPLRTLEDRIVRLAAWPVDLHDALMGDPRCGCGAPDGNCDWDDVRTLEAVYVERSRDAAGVAA